MELLIKLATFGPGTNREPLEGFSRHEPCEQKASQYMHKCINTYVVCSCMATFWLRATRHLLELGFTESDAFETEQLANVSVADNTGTFGLPNPLD